MLSVGLADDVRADFNVMKDLAVHTRIGPHDRVARLQTFISTINKFVCLCFKWLSVEIVPWLLLACSTVVAKLFIFGRC